MADRLSAFLIGLIVGALLSTVYAAYGYFICLLPHEPSDESVIFVHICSFAEGYYWELLVAPAMIGLVFGFDRMMSHIEFPLKVLNQLFDSNNQRRSMNIRTGYERPQKKVLQKTFTNGGIPFLGKIEIITTPSYVIINNRPYNWTIFQSVMVWHGEEDHYPDAYYADIVFKNRRRMTLSSGTIKTISPMPTGQFLTDFDELIFEFRKNSVPIVHTTEDKRFLQ